MSNNENKEINDTKKLLEMSLDDIAKMNNEKKRKFKFGVKKNFRNKRLNNNNRRIRGGNHFKKKFNNNYKSNYNKFDRIKKKENFEKETRTKIEIINLQKEIKDDELNQFFSSVGKIKFCKIQKDENNNSLGIAYIEYYKPESAELAIKNTNGKMMWGGGPLQVDYFKKKNERLSTAGPEVFKLYITNFPGDFTEQNIVELTKEFGAIISCSIKTEKIGRRYALVCYENEEAANRAKASLEGKNVYGYNLFCKIVNDKSYPNPNEVKINKNNNNNFRRFFQRNKPGLINKIIL